jgi:Putative Flp pilus-assembly TadE/G-like
MRRLNPTVISEPQDHGASTVFLILAMTAMLIGVGLAVDVGQYVVHARSVQNSADATVLAVATDCALTGSPIADYSPYRKTGQTISTPSCGSGQATITATQDVGGLFLQQSTGDVDRTATAKWGTIGTANVLPLVISNCEFSQALLNGSTDITIYLDDTKPQSGCSSLPGGFSGLDSNGCEVTITAGNLAAGQPGVGVLTQIMQNGCITPVPKTVFVPMYNSVACQAANCKGLGPYPIVGFAVFKITGYSFNGNNNGGTLGKNCPDQQLRGKYCLRGDFIKFTTTQGTPGPSTDFGLTQVYLYS